MLITQLIISTFTQSRSQTQGMVLSTVIRAFPHQVMSPKESPTDILTELDPLELELQTSVSTHLGAGTQIQVLCKSRSDLNHWSSF